jgi:dTDP-4-dehydrorhamnose 3,5-epimerase
VPHPDPLTEHARWPDDADTHPQWRLGCHIEAEFSSGTLRGPDSDAVAQPLTCGGVEIRALDLPGAWLCTPPQYADDRGLFIEWFRDDRLAEVAGRHFEIVQANLSVSSRGVLRGLHVADVPTGQAKIVACPSGAVLDVAVDVRVGSPTFGQVASVVLDDVDRRVLVIAEGLAHGFCALRDNTVVNYLVTSTYDPSAERTLDALDPSLPIDWPTDIGELTRSPRDVAAPSIEQALSQGILPSYDDCVAVYDAARRSDGPPRP